MALKTVYNEVQKEKKNKVGKDVYMSLDDFVKEHKHLIEVLKNCSKPECLTEAKAQQEELDEELGTKEEQNEPTEADDVE